MGNRAGCREDWLVCDGVGDLGQDGNQAHIIVGRMATGLTARDHQNVGASLLRLDSCVDGASHLTENHLHTGLFVIRDVLFYRIQIDKSRDEYRRDFFLNDYILERQGIANRRVLLRKRWNVIDGERLIRHAAQLRYFSAHIFAVLGGIGFRNVNRTVHAKAASITHCRS